MAWFKRKQKGVVTATKDKKETPDGFWVKTPGGDVIETKELHANQFVTPKEGFHTRIGSKEYFEIIFDDNKYKELNADLESGDPLEFEDTKKYEKLIFGDSDDYFSENRVEASIELLSDHEIVVNDVSLFNDTGIYEEKYMSHRLRDKTKVRLDFIKDKNIFGLSNTALRTSILNKVHFDKDLVAVDWYFYTNLLKQKYNAIFTNGAITYYRQHNDNTVGLKVINDNYYLWFENELED